MQNFILFLFLISRQFTTSPITNNTEQTSDQHIIYASAKAPQATLATNTLEISADLEYSRYMLSRVIAEKKVAMFSLGRTASVQSVNAWFFPGTSGNNALIIGGVHGSELSSVEVANSVISHLMESSPGYYNVIIIPSLFPDNVERAKKEPMQINSIANVGRYTKLNSVDPNRQMPTPGRAFDIKTGTDHLGREIEMENQLLLQLIQTFQPQRIMNIHAIRNKKYGGVYADPRTDHRGFALGYDSDHALALMLARNIDNAGGNILGNNLDTRPTTLYYKDPVPAEPGVLQKRNFSGAALNNDRGNGISLGTWASTAVENEEDPLLNRDAIRVITLEYPGCKRPTDYTDPEERIFQLNQVRWFSKAIVEVFLGEFFVENSSIKHSPLYTKG